jgi:crossover junction endodeoxyribonuclease RuvC
MRVLGIDPGLTGAYALIAGSSVIVDDLPVVEKTIDAAELLRILSVLKPDVAILERVGAMPGNSPNSMFNFGRAVGSIAATVACAGIRTELVTPQVWKRAYNIGRDKEASRALAIRLFPAVTGLARKKDADRAEALLIAHWFNQKETNRNARTA